MPPGTKPKPPGTAHPRGHRTHEWTHAERKGWQHGDLPRCPTGLTKPAKDAWRIWFSSWWASFWTPDDVPTLRIVVCLLDESERGEYQNLPKLIQLMDRYGITPKGRQDLRWAPPKGEAYTDHEAESIADELNRRREERRARLASGGT